MDGKRSCAGGPLVAAAAAVAPVWRALSGPIGSPYYSCCCQGYLMVSTNPMIGCAVLGVRCYVYLFLRRFKGSVCAERFGSRTRTRKCVELDVKRSLIISKLYSTHEDGDDVPRPKTARPDGGCLTIHRQYHYPVLYWLKPPQGEESYWHDNTTCTLSLLLRAKGN